jgi:hypothetical protein
MLLRDRSITAASFVDVYDRVGSRTIEPGRWARVAARVRCHALDRALIAGADPAGSPQLATRAARLTSPPSRASLADGLERLLQAAQEPAGRWRVLPRRAAVLDNAEELRALASVLRGNRPLYARGIAMLDQLLSDGSGPAYVGDRDALACRLRDVRAALAG